MSLPSSDSVTSSPAGAQPGTRLPLSHTGLTSLAPLCWLPRISLPWVMEEAKIPGYAREALSNSPRIQGPRASPLLLPAPTACRPGRGPRRRGCLL